MKIKLLLLAMAAMLCISAANPEQKKIRLFIAGDSTAQSYDPERTPQRGWAQLLPKYLNDNVELVNRAMAGRSSQSFIREGRWEKIVEELQPGDWVIIQFGHNDTSTRPERHASPEQYKANLLKFCTEAREKGANPIIATSIVMRTFYDGELQARRPHFAEYVQYSREVAAEAGVPMIDLNTMTTGFVRSLGDEASRELYLWVKPGEYPGITEEKKDDTHLLEKGADIFAGMAANILKEMDIPLSEYIK